jgi:hypothetical protein
MMANVVNAIDLVPGCSDKLASDVRGTNNKYSKCEIGEHKRPLAGGAHPPPEEFVPKTERSGYTTANKVVTSA